jgi:phosphonate transport system permease protein
MPLIEKDNNLHWKRLNSRQSLVQWLIGLVLLLLFLISWRLISNQTLWAFVSDAPAQGWRIFTRMLPPAIGYSGKLGRPLWDTILIATFGTFGAIILAVPVAFLAARNTSPFKGIFRPFALLIIVATRSINSLAWALLLVTILGPGILAGMIAISLRSIGFIAKLLYEAIEEIDHKQVEAVSATGAHPVQILRIGILPQIMPVFVGIAMYRWDINIRESTVIGLVGAGGIGLQLQASLNVLAWKQVSMILLLVLATVLFSEWLTAVVRKRLL